MLTVKNQSSSVQSNFDVGFTAVPVRFQNISAQFMAPSPIVPMENFQKYVAIVDLDGHSWSSRFGRLLCYNSVILKVDPMYVDYFHFKNNPALLPWVHYVPIKFDLSDLVETVTWVLDPRSEASVTSIIQNANAWCRQQMTLPMLARDYWDIWQNYTNLLELTGAKPAVAEILSNDHLDMVQVMRK